MSRKKKRSAVPRPKPPVPRGQRSDMEVAIDTAAQFTCSHKVVDDFLYQCDDDLEQMAMRIDLAQVASEIWDGRPAHGVTIRELLADYIAVCHRQQQALEPLRARFVALKEFLARQCCRARQMMGL
jgi:hypothetical protein